jgi:hypothetical protein
MKAFDSKEVKKKAPTMFIELVDQRDSGWVLDGTAGTPHEKRLKSPSAEFIPNRGFRLVKTKDEDGETIYMNEAIRFIKNCPTLSVEEQNKRGFRPSKNKQEDLIIVKGGNFSVTKEGSFSTLYDYLEQVFYNESNEKRPDSAKAIFRVIEFGKKEEIVNEKEIAQADAIQFIGTLYTKKGKGDFVYNEDKINALCQLFLVFAESPSGKINGLIGHAKKNPEEFLSKAMKFEQTIVMEITQGLDLGVFHFDKNIATYSNKEKAIASVGTGNLSQPKKIERLANILGSDEYKSHYAEFKIELDAAKEKQLG